MGANVIDIISFIFYFLVTIMQRKSNQCFLQKKKKKKRKNKKKKPMVSRAHEAQCERWAPFASKENEWNRGLVVNFVP